MTGAPVRVESRVRIELGVPGQIMPPASAAVKFAQRAEADGFDAIWWPDHLMGWHPDSLWTPDLTPLAASQADPHTYFDPLVMMGAVGAQTMLTLDHLTQGRAILGLGSGEQLNITPYGLPWDKPVARLAEGIEVIRLLWGAEGPVDFEGRFFSLRRGVLGLSLFGLNPPPIWTAAHGPRMLELTGRQADGWLPTKLTPQEYGASLAVIRKAAAGAGRDPDAITPGDARVRADRAGRGDRAAADRAAAGPGAVRAAARGGVPGAGGGAAAGRGGRLGVS